MGIGWRGNVGDEGGRGVKGSRMLERQYIDIKYVEYESIKGGWHKY